MTPSLHKELNGGDAFLKSFLAGQPTRQVLLVCRPTSFELSGARNWLESVTGLEWPAFYEFSSNPKIEDVERGLELFHSIEAKAVMGIGGGSVLDMAKLINFFGSHHIQPDDYLSDPSGATGTIRPLLAIPTTAGSGSEATHFAVVYRNQIKYSVAHPDVRPSHVLLAPEFTASSPSYQTACSGMDALAQGIESCWARSATAESKSHAKEAIRLALKHLVAAVNTPGPEDRRGMMEAAYRAGRAIDISKTTGAHAFSYALTVEFDLPHGHAVGLLLPYFMDYHLRSGIHVEGIDGSSLRDLLQSIGLVRTLPASAHDIHALLTRAVNLERLANNPIPVTDEFLGEISAELAER